MGKPLSGGRANRTPVTKLIHDILADEQWHDYESLVGWIAASGLFNGKVRYFKGKVATPTVLAREAVKTAVKGNSYERRLRPAGRRHYIEAVRKSPHLRHGQTLKSCSRCGASSLELNQRVRRVLEYRIPRAKGRGNTSTGLGDVIAAKMPTQYLCIPCASTELAANGAEWRIVPPFNYESGEVRRQRNPAGYIRRYRNRG